MKTTISFECDDPTDAVYLAAIAHMYDQGNTAGAGLQREVLKNLPEAIAYLKECIQDYLSEYYISFSKEEIKQIRLLVPDFGNNKHRTR